MTLAPGTRLGPYELVGQIGAGGMGEVWKARDPKLDRFVAIKVLPAAVTEDPERLRRFQIEARAASALNHPNILTVHDLGEHEGAPYLVMELLEGRTLRAVMDQGPLAPERVAELGEQAAAGLAAAHERGIVHRDLKPENLFLTGDGVLKILDFGLAKRSQLDSFEATAALSDLTLSGRVMGTLSYMSPEQATGRAIGFPSDQFSFGVVLYELLSGRRPFSGESAAETLAAIVRDEPAPLENLSLGVPQSLGTIVKRCLAKEPQDRYASTKELARQLSVARLQAASGETAATGLRPAQPKATPRRLRHLLLAAALTVVAAALGVFLWKPWKVAPARIATLVALPTKVHGTNADAWLTDGIPGTLSTFLATAEGFETKEPPSSVEMERLKGDTAKVAEAYRADTLLLTTLTVQGERFYLDAKLVEAATRKVRWASQLEGRRDTYNDLVRQAAVAVARALRPQGAQPAGLPAPAFRSEVELALREGRHFVSRYDGKGEEADFEQGLAALQRAQSLEPTSARLAAELAWLFNSKAFLINDPLALQQEKTWARRALELDPRCGLAWAALSMAEANTVPRADPDKIAEFALKAVTSSPEEPRVHWTMGAVLPTAGGQALAGRHIMELDPLNPMGYDWAGLGLMESGRPAEAVAILERLARLDPTHSKSWLLHRALYKVGRKEDALKAFAPGWATGPIQDLLNGDLAAAREKCRRQVAHWHKNEKLFHAMDWGNRAAFFAPLLVHLDMREDAFWILGKAMEGGLEVGLDTLHTDPDLQKLRGDPRFTRILASSRDSLLRFQKQADAAEAQGPLPPYLKAAVAEARELAKRHH